MQKKFFGQITFELLFINSKSEGRYPVLYCDDGIAYRIHAKGESFRQEPYLADYIGKTVQILGKADNIRGHWRIIIDPQIPDTVSLFSTQDENFDRNKNGDESSNNLL